MNLLSRPEIKNFIKRYGYHFLVFVLPVLIYLPTLSGTFYYDDNVIFIGHQAKQLAADPFSVFDPENHYLPGAARSLHVFVLLNIYRIFGADPFAYHVLNLLLHGVATLIFFILIRELASGNERSNLITLIGALIFGLHPIHVENITFVTLGGTDLFMTLWAILSLILYLHFRKRTDWRRFVFLVLSLAAYFFSLMSKETAMGFIFVYPLTEFLFGRKGYAWVIPYAAIVIVNKWGLMLTGGAMVMAGGAEMAGTEGTVMLILQSLAYFLKNLVVPYPQSVLVKELPGVPQTLGILLAAAIVIAASLYFLKERRRLMIFSSLFLLVTAAPYLLVPFARGNVAVSAERYIYAASAGFSLFAAAAAVFIRPRKVLLLASIAILSVYAGLGLNYFNDAWRSEEAFWQNVVDRNPEYVTGYKALASVKLKKGDTARAVSLLNKGLSKTKGMHAEFGDAAMTLGQIAESQGNLALAERHYLTSLGYSKNQLTYVALGFLQLKRGFAKQAKWAFENALRFSVRSSRATYGLAKCYSLLGDEKMARQFAYRVTQMTRDPGLIQAAAELLK